MPFDVAGNFTRSYNFQQDRDNGIKILAARVDGEFDNFATGMNAVFFRDGRVPMQADLRMNINRITGLADGSVGSPALKFNTDASTGPYLAGLSQYAIAVNGVQRAVFNTAGVDVTGTLNASGAISQGGVPLNTTFAPKAAPVFTNPVTIDGPSATVRGLVYATAGAGVAEITLQTDNTTLRRNVPTKHQFDVAGVEIANITSAGLNMGSKLLTFTDASGTKPYFTQQGDNNFVFYGTNSAGAARPIWSTGMRSDTSYFTINPNVYINGGTLWVGGNNKLLVQHDATNGYVRAETGALHLGAGGVNVARIVSDNNSYFNGPVTVQTTAGAAQGYATVSPGGAGVTGWLGFYMGGGSRAGYIGNADGSWVDFTAEGARSIRLTGSNVKVVGEAIIDNGTSESHLYIKPATGYFYGAAGAVGYYDPGSGAHLQVSYANGTVSMNGKELGYRGLPSIGTAAYTPVNRDERGGMIKATGNVTINPNVYAADDVVVVYNNSAAAISIVQGAGMTLRLAGTATAGTRTLAQRGFATITFITATDAVVSGNVT